MSQFLFLWFIIKIISSSPYFFFWGESTGDSLNSFGKFNTILTRHGRGTHSGFHKHLLYYKLKGSKGCAFFFLLKAGMTFELQPYNLFYIVNIYYGYIVYPLYTYCSDGKSKSVRLHVETYLRSQLEKGKKNIVCRFPVTNNEHAMTSQVVWFIFIFFFFSFVHKIPIPRLRT